MTVKLKCQKVCDFFKKMSIIPIVYNINSQILKSVCVCVSLDFINLTLIFVLKSMERLLSFYIWAFLFLKLTMEKLLFFDIKDRLHKQDAKKEFFCVKTSN